MKNDDVALIHRVLGGDDSVFPLLVEKYQATVRELVLRKIGDAHITEEITQAIFLKVHQKLGMLKEPQGFQNWLHVIATRCCIEWLRKKYFVAEAQSK
ncbi:hypothetical protein F4009_24980 [Candidatus Poribacteria bacterium]|nr:hypothetical protein [Candidatus Poribacteria bacterium]MYA72814.1 hypothetical protein [Candidatus Poribacteria bacterium]MYH79424.1 hypothetical protein [Candidatus Poribacteria bacterium]MYK97212.1 hypothetical protein [Candidatus Poribacteria bacterium]